MAKKDAEAVKPVIVRHGKLRRSNAWSNALRILLTTTLVVALSGVATIAYAVWGTLGQAKTVDIGSGPEIVGANAESLDGAVTILLVGSDSRQGQSWNDGNEGELNDVTLMLHISADHKNATVVSFPRDLMLPIPSCPNPDGGDYPAMSEQQLNSTLSYGGLPCTVLTIEALTGMDINYAGLITFDGVVGVSNALGGVDVCLANPIWDPDADLSLNAGNNTLKGMEALQFLRTRHGVGDGGDTSRISNQQIFMSSLVRKLKNADTLSDPVKVFSLAKAAVTNMTLSKNMQSVDFMLAMARTVKDIDLDRVNFVQYPATDHPYQEGRLTPNRVSAEALFDVIKSGQPFDLTGVGQGVAIDGVDSSGTNATADPATPDATETPTPTPTPTDGTTPTPNANGKVELPSDITGVRPDQNICSLGRTVY
ncbi:hypothetical protein G7068_07910 [Leucobacter viscericola]|uniref:Cell envelope-related transcriptional attenuator domain-containing protein n=1 Tax=Leucobacter viscericola TaxID=2714935 RepID=A0A6G7XF07_9MICO|nr:LCP family protein [Leucobacter viscericola]QIK63133.1 hypothetical protein G7068_07910 [Leucobacter viscericola]